VASTRWDVPASLMATMSSPGQRRLDHRHSLETAAQRLADAVEAGADTDQPAADFAGLIDELERYERFWLFPGLATLRRLREYLINWDAVLARQLASRAVHRLSEFGDAGSLFDLEVPLADQHTDQFASGRHFIGEPAALAPAPETRCSKPPAGGSFSVVVMRCLS